MKAANLRREVGVLRDPHVLLAMLMSVLASASLFCVFTYITPILETVSHLSPHAVTLVLLLFGAGLTAGNFIGGRLADWKLMPSVLGVFLIEIGVVAAFYFTSRNAITAVATVFVFGVVAFALVPLLQLRVVDTAAGAPNLASTLNQGAFNLGNASGAWIGGAAITLGAGYPGLALVSALIAAVAFAVSIVSARIAVASHAQM
jgi:DHA1 family inner membrane transport protein